MNNAVTLPVGRRRGHAFFKEPPEITAYGTIAGKKESEGPFGHRFDRVLTDESLGEKSFERAERKILVEAVRLALHRADVDTSEVDVMFAGDLLDQLVTANFAGRDLGIPLLGVYGACSTSAESLLLAAMAVSSGYARYALAATGSHHLAAERQYRYPLELGVQRLPTAQWTATGAAAFLVGAGTGAGAHVKIRSGTVGRVHDAGIKDVNNMGAAMAPAAADTIARHLDARAQTIRDYDIVLTGDLARVGHGLLADLLHERGIDTLDRLADAGIMLYDQDQDVHAGGSGAACSALVLAASVLPRLQRREISRALLVATGSLHSPRSYQQGETIPSIAHAVELEVGA